jgi:cholera toxin transcriptional activator
LSSDTLAHMTDPRLVRRYRFGAFEADGATGELRRQGMRVKLNAQPFQVLCMLLERPGELLTREEISRELWPDGTFVDYEHGVNSAVNRIREALGDTAGNPRFVETLARRGYRFVAPVERIGPSEDASPPTPEFSPSVLAERTAVRAEAESGLFSRVLASPHELPKTSYPVVQTLFVLMQAMYLGFYVGALANLAEIEDLFSPLPRATQVLAVMIVTAAILIPVRAFVISAVLFHAPRAREKLLRIWPFLLPLDELWSLSPFLLLHHINFGLALSCTALLVYSPFAQRSLVLMGAGGVDEASATVR